MCFLLYKRLGVTTLFRPTDSFVCVRRFVYTGQNVGYNNNKEEEMKIEKISENQIKCTLTAEDLAARKIRLSELAYGTSKARDLFADMMKEAYKKFGFKADNIPLIIEAMPMNADSIVLFITKADDPEELDTRFSRFTPAPGGAAKKEQDQEIVGADSIIDAVRRMNDARKTPAAARKGVLPGVQEYFTKKKEEPVDLVRCFVFDTIDDVIHAAASLGDFYKGANSLFRTERDGLYSLVVHQGGHTPEEFNKVCNILSEYGTNHAYSAAAEAHMSEHEKTVLKGSALQQLRKV